MLRFETRMLSWCWLSVAILLPTITACSSDIELDEDAQLGVSRQQVVYGSDNRQDVFAATNPTMAALARSSTVAVIGQWRIDDSDPDDVQFTGARLQEAKNLCSSERFLDDPTAAWCSGTLIGDDLVLTAGHCVENDLDCGRYRFVFDYYRDSASTLESISANEDVYNCDHVVSRVNDENGIDYAVIRLDRPATPHHTPAPIQRHDQVASRGTGMGVIGSGSGIPFKIDVGGRVRSDRERQRDFYVLNSDTFGGNSGSGIYSLTDYELTGILVRGARDYVANGGCDVVNVCSEGGCAGESATYFSRALEGLCEEEPGNMLCEDRIRFAFEAENTSSATRNTRRQWVSLEAGEAVSIGTCGVDGASATGDTYLRVYNAVGTQVAANDDACGLQSRVTFTAPASGLYEIAAGCYSSRSCSGTVAVERELKEGSSYVISEERDPVECPVMDPFISKVGCSNRFCDNLHITCSDAPAPAQSATLGNETWTSWFSEEGTNYRHCPDGSFLSGVDCSNDFCDNLRLRCTSLPGLVSSSCSWSGWYSEEYEDFEVPSGKLIRGVQCGGRFCDNKRYYTCNLTEYVPPTPPDNNGVPSGADCEWESFTGASYPGGYVVVSRPVGECQHEYREEYHSNGSVNVVYR